MSGRHGSSWHMHAHKGGRTHLKRHVPALAQRRRGGMSLRSQTQSELRTPTRCTRMMRTMRHGRTDHAAGPWQCRHC